MSDLLLLLVAGVNFFGGLVIGEYARRLLEEKNETTESLFSAENVREFLRENPSKDIFGTDSPSEIYMRHTAAEAINKIKAYEEKQKADDKIEVGDEVNWLGDCFIVTRIFQPRNMKEQCDGIDDDGCVYSNVLIDDLVKTGRHFDIASILEDMRK